MRAVVLAALLGACSFEPGKFPSSPGDASDATSGDVDTDGDGLADLVDNCPDLANAAQHDWDGDSHGDECDHCPHLVSASDPDGDRDGVGDACDPRPAAAGDRRVIWIAFYDPSDIAGWANTGNVGQWSVANGKLTQSANGFALLDSPLQYGDVYFATRVEIIGTGNEVGFCSGDQPIGMQYYCCGAYLNGNNQARAVATYAGSPMAQLADVMPFPASVAGDTIDIVGKMTATRHQCTLTKNGTFVMLETMRGTSMGTAVFYATAPVRYHYAFVVAIGS